MQASPAPENASGRPKLGPARAISRLCRAGRPYRARFGHRHNLPRPPARRASLRRTPRGVDCPWLAARSWRRHRACAHSWRCVTRATCVCRSTSTRKPSRLSPTRCDHACAGTGACACAPAAHALQAPRLSGGSRLHPASRLLPHASPGACVYPPVCLSVCQGGWSAWVDLFLAGRAPLPMSGGGGGGGGEGAGEERGEAAAAADWFEHVLSWWRVARACPEQVRHAGHLRTYIWVSVLRRFRPAVAWRGVLLAAASRGARLIKRAARRS